jgi:hypothetical protein
MSSVDSFKKLWTEQPLLVGCGCALVLTVLMCGAGGLLLGLGWQVGGSKISGVFGVDSILATSKSLSERGLSFSVSNTTEAGSEYTLVPMQPREVTCDELKAALGPHLVGDLARIVIISESTVAGADGTQTSTVPVRCTWDAGAAALPSTLPSESDREDIELPAAGP